MFFAHFRDGEGCKSYIVGCEETCAAAIIDPALDLVDRYIGEIGKHGLRVRYLIDTHTHADHFSGAQALRKEFGAPIVMHRYSRLHMSICTWRRGIHCRWARCGCASCIRPVTRSTRWRFMSRTASSPATRC